MIGVCEGRFFERLGDAMGAAQKVVLEQTPCALGVAADDFCCPIMPRYVTQLGESFCCPSSKFSFEP